MKIIERIKNGLDTFGKYWALVIVILFILPAFEALVMRYTLNRPTIWSQELCCMIFGAYFMIGGAYGEACHAHVSMDLFYVKYRGIWKIIADTLTMFACGLFCIILITRVAQRQSKPFPSASARTACGLRISGPSGCAFLWALSCSWYGH